MIGEGMEEKIGVVGLGYVGLPVALAFARHFAETVGFDIDQRRVEDLRRGFDRNGDQDEAALRQSTLRLTSDGADLRGCTFIVVAVPTPVDRENRPDLSPVVGASKTVGQVLSGGEVVVFESTVYPGVTEAICGPTLEQASGLRAGTDFTLGYSPERINPGDREHTLERIIKVVSGQDPRTLDRVAAAYGRIVTAGVHRAPSIQVAEAAKVIENTQRDLNIALMNEIALICDRLDIRTADVLAAARTKWNFLPFAPGLVGGHCIGVDPYYLTARAEQLGYQPEVILAGRRINNGMGEFVAEKVVKLLINADVPVKAARVGILGLAFKENISDMRNSRVPGIVRELGQFGIQPLVHDPLCAPEEALATYGITLRGADELTNLDGLILAVAHGQFMNDGPAAIVERVKPGGVLVDVKSVIPLSAVPQGVLYWSL
jgi:UDP-N-acetyl-D-glucosamine/UDP-N-acetyl-D-galactosamine dehydrogenase